MNANVYVKKAGDWSLMLRLAYLLPRKRNRDMIEQQTCEHVESPAPHLGETWVTLADLSQMIGIHPDTIRSAVRKVRERQEPWVKKAPDARRRMGEMSGGLTRRVPGIRNSSFSGGRVQTACARTATSSP